MKTIGKLLIVLGATVALGIAFASAALADEGPHGGYGASSATSNTDKCAACHRAHTAVNPELLVQATITELCVSCHGTTGTGADTDVLSGRFLARATYPFDPNYQDPVLGANSEGQWLNGGGFLQAANMVQTGTGPGVWASSTSRHGVAGLAGNGILSAVAEDATRTAWGGGPPADGVTGLTALLECTSCHDPHGSRNYRLLQRGANRASLITWTPGAAAFLTNNVWSDQVKPKALGGADHDYTLGRSVAYDRGMSDFCASCHTNYTRALNGVGGTSGGYAPDGQVYDAGDGKSFTTRYRHPVSAKAVWNGTAWDSSINVLAINSWVATGTTGTGAKKLRRVSTDNTATNGQYVTCLTCHFAHGSSAAATGYAQQVAPTNGSALLFLDNRGVCQACHSKSTSEY